MKKITKFLDSVMGGIKRTCIAKALAVFAVASVTTSSFAQTTKTTKPVINGVEDFEGLTYEQVRAAAVADNTFPTDNKSKILFFYNVKTGKFLNVGGYWGTCVSLHEYGRAMWVNVKGSAFYFAMDMNTSVGKYMGYVHTGNNTKDKGVFVDREEADKIASTAWFIDPVDGDEKNTFRIYTEAPSNGSSYDNMYLSANPDYNGANLNCTVYKNPTKGYDEWRIFTYAQIYQKQTDGIVDNMKNALELSFRLKCPGFERGDNDIENWKTYNFKDKNQNEVGFAKFGLEKLYNTTASWGEKEETYDVNDLSSGYTFEKETYNELDNYRRNLGKYYCSSIKGKCGMIYQDISITLPGTYVVECKGYSNTPKAKLFAGVLDPDNKNKMVHGTMNYTMLSQVSNMSAAEQEKLHTAEYNMDYAGKEFYDSRKYVNSVVLTVPESAFKKADGTKYESLNIRLGVMTGAYSTDVSKLEDPAPGEWTVFDDFRLQYASKNTAQDLVLDEMRADLNYLYDTTNKYENTTLHLNKTLTPNKWNSLVLPVSLTKEQLQSTFGANVRLAKLQTLTSTGIEFESVDLNKEALQAYMPYIIFPERTSNASDAYTAYLTDEDEQESLKVIVPAGHYTIAKVTMGDLSQINKKDWTTMLNGGDGTIKAYGTFARTFGTASQDENDGYKWKFTDKSTIIAGRPNLEYCYFFDKGNMYHSSIEGRVRGLRGFSCWFQPTTTSGAQNAQLTIDGVSQGTTGIEDILADYEQPVSRFANGIYNLNGQLVKQGNSTAGLPSGLYIVNGKKCIVR